MLAQSYRRCRSYGQSEDVAPVLPRGETGVARLWKILQSSAATSPVSATASETAIPPSTNRLKALARPTTSEP